MKKQEFSAADALKIASRIKRLIPDRTTQTAFAHSAGLSQPSMSAILAGPKQFKAFTAASIARALKCSTDYLLLLSDSPNHRALTKDEQTLLDGFRLMGPSGKAILLDAAKGYIARSEEADSKTAA